MINWAIILRVNEEHHVMLNQVHHVLGVHAQQGVLSSVHSFPKETQLQSVPFPWCPWVTDPDINSEKMIGALGA